MPELPMRARLFALCLAVLPLAGCIDAEVTIDFKDETTVETAMDLRLGREIYDLTGGDPQKLCKGGTATVGTDTVSCVQRRTMTLDEFLADAQATATPNSPDAALRKAVVVERLDDRRLKVSFDFAGLAAAGGPEAAQARQMGALMRGVLAGHDLVFRIRAPEIEATTGTLSEDGRTAEYVLPLVAVLSDTAPQPFVTTLALKTCWFGFLCF
jgi:hypothetical protein